MAVRASLAFGAGVVTGWTARAALGSTREALVRAVVLAHGVRERLQRTFAEQSEWVEDMLAEGRARAEAGRDRARHARGARAKAPRGVERRGRPARRPTRRARRRRPPDVPRGAAADPGVVRSSLLVVRDLLQLEPAHAGGR